jgi:hypothetical protein
MTYGRSRTRAQLVADRGHQRRPRRLVGHDPHLRSQEMIEQQISGNLRSMPGVEH